MRRATLRGAALLALLAAAGCSDGTKGVTTAGRVTLDGQPLTRGEVVLAAEQGDVIRQGTVQKDGTFQVPDIPPGKYKAGVRVNVYSPEDYDVGERGKQTLKKGVRGLNVPSKLQDPATSGLSYDVGPGKEIVIDLTSQ